MILTNLIKDNIEKYPEYELLTDQNRSITNYEMYNITGKVAQMLKNNDVEQGDRVAVCMPNCLEVIFSYQGIWHAGAVTVPLMFLLHAQEIKHILETSRAKVIITSKSVYPKVREAIQMLQSKPSVIVVDDVEDSTIEFDDDVIHFSDEIDQIQDQYYETNIEKSDLAVILFTSGTTGDPKGVMLTHKNLYSVCVNGASLFKEMEQSYTIAVLPLAHSFGLTLTNRILLQGNSCVVMRRFDVEELCAAIEEYNVRWVNLVPAMIQQLVHTDETNSYNLSSLEIIISGSAPLSLQIHELFHEKFSAQILEGYGLTEASPAVSTHVQNKPIKVGSVGIPIPGVSVKVVDELGKELPPNEVGELVVQGDNITPGYFENEEATEEALKNGWLHTGDMAKIDEDGYIFIVDRKKDLIIRGGFNIYPRDLEELLMKHPDINEAAVIGVPSETMGEEIVAVLSLKEQSQISEEDILQFCQDRLAKYKTPRKVIILDSLPRNGVGKIMKNNLIELAVKEEVLEN